MSVRAREEEDVTWVWDLRSREDGEGFYRGREEGHVQEEEERNLLGVF